MTDMLPITAWWPRRNVREVEAPDAGLLEGAPRAWLWLDGSHSSMLQDDVFAITHRFDALWVWRHTDWEYAGPGYRAGPMLVPLSESLLDHFLANWAVSQTGLIVLGGDGHQLVEHLQHLRQITAANGDTVRFRLNAARPFEELCEALRGDGLTRLLGPMAAVIWYAGDADAPLWLRIDNPAPAPSRLQNMGGFELGKTDQSSLNAACRQWFMRDTVHTLAQSHWEAVEPLGGDELKRQLDLFAGEAMRVGIVRERDMQEYLRLRLLFPQEPFVHDTPLRTLLADRTRDPRLRLAAMEKRLQDLSPLTV